MALEREAVRGEVVNDMRQIAIYGKGGIGKSTVASNLSAALNGTGLSGYLALGSNGEAVHLDEDEAERVVRTVCAAAAQARPDESGYELAVYNPF